MLQIHDPEKLYLALWNFNFGTKQPKDSLIVRHILDTYPETQMIAGVETKVDNFHGMLPRKTWCVIQNTTRDFKRNVVIAYLRGALRRPKIRGLKVGVTPHGVKMLTRPLRIIDLDLYCKTHRRWERCRVIVGHRPPRRYKFLNPLFDAAVKFRIKVRKWSRQGRWVLCEDFNEPGKSVAKKFGGTFHGSGIDGYITGPSMTIAELQTDDVPKRKGWTDHVGNVGALMIEHSNGAHSSK